MKIDRNKDLYIRIKGLTDGLWVDIVTSKAKIDLENYADDNEVANDAEKMLDQFNDVVNQAYKDNTNGYVQLGNTSLSILKFDAIQVLYVQDDEEITFND